MDASLSFIALGKIKKTLLEVPIKADGSEIETGNIFHFKRQDQIGCGGSQLFCPSEY